MIAGIVGGVDCRNGTEIEPIWVDEAFRGQGIGSDKFPGVLGRQDDKGPGQGVGYAVHGHLVLLHDLQQGGLGFRTGTVDFIGQDDLAHDGALPVFHLAGLEIGQRIAGDVRGHQVWGKLDAPEGAIQGAGEGAGQGGFAYAGHILDQYMALAEQRDQRVFDGFLLADDGLGDGLLEGDDHPAGIEHGQGPPLSYRENTEEIIS